MLGHPHRAALRWLGTEACYQATEPDLPPSIEDIVYDNGGAADPLPAAYTRLTRATVYQILDTYLHTEHVPTT